jgi:hypothetical protein
MEQQMKIIADAVNEIMRQTLVDRDEIERLRGQSRMNWDAFQKAATEIERLRHEFRELHRDISMFMDDGPLKQDLLETIADILGEEK